MAVGSSEETSFSSCLISRKFITPKKSQDSSFRRPSVITSSVIYLLFLLSKTWQRQKQDRCRAMKKRGRGRVAPAVYGQRQRASRTERRRLVRCVRDRPCVYMAGVDVRAPEKFIVPRNYAPSRCVKSNSRIDWLGLLLKR